MNLGKAREVAKKNRISPETVEAIETFGPEKRKNYSAGQDKRYYISVYEEPSLGRTKTEATFYSLIRNKTSLRAPKTVEYGDKYIIVEGLKGERYANFFEEAGTQEKTEIVREHAKALANIHSISIDYGIGEFTEDGFQEYGDWKSFIQDRIESYESRANLEVEKKAVKWLKENIDIIDRDIVNSVVHDDFHIWNTLKKENQSIGVLDAEQAFFGDKEYDLVKTMSRWTDRQDLSEEFLDEYQRHGHLEKGYEDRLRFYEVEIHLRGTINAREKVEGGRDDLNSFYQSDKQFLEQFLAE